MTTIKVDTITNAAGSGAPNIPDGVTIGGTALASLTNTMDYTASATEPTSPNNGAIWWDTGNDKLFQYMNGSWIEVVYTDIPVFFGSRGLFAYRIGSPYEAIDYITIATPSNATDFGDLVVFRDSLAGCSNGSRGLFAGGENSRTNRIDYVTIATTGNAQDFGDLTVSRGELGGCSDGVYGVFGGGKTGGGSFSYTNVIDYVTISTTGNAQDFGDLLAADRALSACSSRTYGLFGGGFANDGDSNVIQYITIATTGNATDFGDLIGDGTSQNAACSDGSRGLFAGGYDNTVYEVNRIEYVTIDTPSNSTDFGDLTVARYSLAGCSDGTYGVFGGGYDVSNYTNVIDYVTISTPSNASDFGDLTSIYSYGVGSCSGA